MNSKNQSKTGRYCKKVFFALTIHYTADDDLMHHSASASSFGQSYPPPQPQPPRHHHQHHHHGHGVPTMSNTSFHACQISGCMNQAKRGKFF
jgi:hypothetical protein